MLWLSGFFSGWSFATNGASSQGGPSPVPAPVAKSSITVLFGTESGNSEALADEAKKVLTKRGFKVSVKDMGDIKPGDLAKAESLLVIVSTWGEGDPPARAEEFYAEFMNGSAPRLEKVRFAVCGLGDSSYSQFCQMGKDFDSRLETLGAQRLVDRVDCDVDYEADFKKWLDAAVAALEKLSAPAAPVLEVQTFTPGVASPAGEQWTRTNPFRAELLERINLNGTGSSKETYHLEISLEGSGITYTPGDALGVKPKNCPDVVDELLEVARIDGDAEVNRADGSAGTLRTVLIEELDSTTLSHKVVQAFAEATGLEKVKELAGDAVALRNYCQGRQVVDLFEDFSAAGVQPQQLADMLRLQPARLYSISSSQAAHPDAVHITVGAVRYESNGRSRKGVASTYLADRVEVGDLLPVYVHANTRFRLPENPDTPIIMVGPGTGIAPFRAFMQERAETGAKGKNWLFFGDQHFLYDFLYQLEWQNYVKEGVLTRMDVAFSRDTPEKVYVQHRIREHSREFYAWLQEGAHIYICGDAHRMAKDVNQAIQDVIAREGGMSEDKAREYLTALTKENRYQRDVY